MQQLSLLLLMLHNTILFTTIFQYIFNVGLKKRSLPLKSIFFSLAFKPWMFAALVPLSYDRSACVCVCVYPSCVTLTPQNILCLVSSSSSSGEPPQPRADLGEGSLSGGPHHLAWRQESRYAGRGNAVFSTSRCVLSIFSRTAEVELLCCSLHFKGAAISHG